MNRFYFDHNATTPVSQLALDAYVRASMDGFGNASSIHHAGQNARRQLEAARSTVARFLGADPKEVVFCSGGTEADNTALFGVIRRRANSHLITTTIEHPAILQAAAQLEREGHEVTYVSVGRSGIVEPDDVRRAFRSNTVLVSVMHVNNEIGTVQPVAEIAAIAKERGITMHSDGVQAPGRVAVTLRELGIDLYSVSGHKMYAPKGIGVLFVRKGTPAAPLLYGGRHEGGWRPGTENVPGAVALSAAAESSLICGSQLRDRLEEQIQDRIPDVQINGVGGPRSPNTSSLCFDGIEGEAIVIALDLKGFSISSGAACSSGAVEPSHVLTAIGLSRRDAKSCIRISLGASNTAEQVDALADALAQVTARLRKLSPDYLAHV